MIKVAIDDSPLRSGHKVRGIGVNTKELIHALKKFPDELLINSVDVKNDNLEKYDLVHITHFNPYFLTIPFPKPKSKLLITIHDLIQLKYPKHYPPGLKGSLRFIIQKFLLKQADGILTISEDAKKDLVKKLGIKPQKVHVVLLAARKILTQIKNDSILMSAKKKFNLPKDYVLYVGDINYNKNILTLIKACESLKTPLVIVGKKAKEIEEMGMGLKDLKGPRDWVRFVFGKPHPELAHYIEIAKEFAKNNEIIRTGYLDENDLVAIYNLASVYVQPSFSEGFGLSVLEAQACGTPVVASDIGAHREIARDSVLFFDPKSEVNLADKIKKVMTNKKLRGDLIDKGLVNSEKYSWEKTARGVIDVYKKICKN